jgi:hypothetical protein
MERQSASPLWIKKGLTKSASCAFLFFFGRKPFWVFVPWRYCEAGWQSLFLANEVWRNGIRPNLKSALLVWTPPAAVSP